ncbi:MAG TPA: ATP-binding protein, partial [Phycisphaerales bacterium]|nr:ATP-binding protein [Phycisphaerales bacterium]
VVGLLTGHLEPDPLPPVDVDSLIASAPAPIDFAEVKGQEAVKRALTVAAAGGHNILMLGPAGTGKTMMARALPGIMPPMSAREALDVTRIYSAAGRLPPGEGLIRQRPVRSPHHTASSAAIVGGGVIPRPGEISLSHLGVLFLDELPEFPRTVLETLRQPIEDRHVTIARAHGSVTYPTDFMLVAAMNPTPRGDVSPGEVGRREMERYMGRISGPMLERIDIHAEAPRVPWDELSKAPKGTGTSAMREAVAGARARQSRRQGSLINANLSGKQLDELAPMTDAAMGLLGEAIRSLGLSARAYDKIRRVSRSIADLAGADELLPEHVAEAIGYRLLDRKL